MPKKVYKRPRQIAVYAETTLVDKLQEEAKRRRRKLGPTALEILREFFDTNDKKQPADAEARS